MKIAEMVTFGGITSGAASFDRAAHLRGDATALADVRAAPESRAIMLWRGKPLIGGTADAALVRLPLDHPVLADAAAEPIFLGCEAGQARFAFDLSRWDPEDVDFSTLGTFLDPTEQFHPALAQDQRFCELRAVMTRLDACDAALAATAKAVMGWHATHGFCALCGASSVMAKAGWQRDCPSCGGHHFPRTDPVVIMLITHGNDVLLGRAPAWPEGMYSLIAGFVEPGETMEAAVRREVFEETGVAVGAVGYLSSQPWPFPASLMLGCRGEALNRAITLDPEELEDAVWVSRERLMDVFAGRDTTIKPAREGAIAHFLLANWLADRLD